MTEIKEYNKMTVDEIQEGLSAPTPIANVKWKPIAIREDYNTDGYTALALAHCDARFIQNRLDFVVGCLNWQSDTKVHGGLLLVGIGIRDPRTNEWIWKWDTGQDKESGKDSAGGKGIVSGGLKRAGFQWGIARDLYDFPRLRLKCKTYTSKRTNEQTFSAWIENPWEAMDTGKGESEETNRPHRSRVDTKQNVDETIKANATTFYDICYAKLELDTEQARESMAPFFDQQTSITDWDRAIRSLEMNLPEEERAYTVQAEKAKVKDAQGDKDSS